MNAIARNRRYKEFYPRLSEIEIFSSQLGVVAALEGRKLPPQQERRDSA
jgi:hypothetical protein